MTAAELDAKQAAALLYLRRSLGTSVGIHHARVRDAFARLRKDSFHSVAPVPSKDLQAPPT